MAAKAFPDPIHSSLYTAVDARFYRTVYDDIARAAVDPVAHYASEGWTEGRDPAPWFSTEAYLTLHPDVVGVNPLLHYLQAGWREGREITPSRLAQAYLTRLAQVGEAPGWRYEPDPRRFGPKAGSEPPLSPEDRRRAAEAFDADFYRAAYPDVGASDIDPLDHFLLTGWREGRDPGRDFSTRDYLESNPDVAASGRNPFLHYIDAGRREGRSPRRHLGYRHDVIAGLQTLDQRRASALTAAGAQVLSPRDDLIQALAGRGSGPLHLTFSHDDYARHVGGVQLCLRRESAAVQRSGRDHLHVYPRVPWPTVRREGDLAPMGVLWNGADLGAFAAVDILAVLQGAGRLGGSFAIHSLQGHAVGEVLALLAALGLTKGYFWLHDFTSLCAGVHLLRDDVADCGAPPQSSGACRICVYGPGRALHLDAHARLFRALDLVVAAPSRSAYDTWRASAPAPADTPWLIHPHLTFRPAAPAASPPPEGPLRAAFLGMASGPKGWPAFAALAARFADDPRYEFWRLASNEVAAFGVRHHTVSVTEQAPDAMVQALKALAIDVAVLWSQCRETFSFTAHEAAAAGCAVLTGPDSGNVAAFVTEGGHGRVVADDDALTGLFASGQVLFLARSVRAPPLYDLVPGALTADLLEAR